MPGPEGLVRHSRGAPAPDGPTSAQSSPGMTTPLQGDKMRLAVSVCLSITCEARAVAWESKQHDCAVRHAFRSHFACLHWSI